MMCVTLYEYTSLIHIRNVAMYFEIIQINQSIFWHMRVNTKFWCTFSSVPTPCFTNRKTCFKSNEIYICKLMILRITSWRHFRLRKSLKSCQFSYHNQTNPIIIINTICKYNNKDYNSTVCFDIQLSTNVFLAMVTYNLMFMIRWELFANWGDICV